MLYLVLLLTFISFIQPNTIKYRHINFEADSNVVSLIQKFGYNATEHFVETEDGYILSVIRMNKLNVTKKPNTHIAFLQHGLLDSSATWVINQPEESFAFLLANDGYDVWLGNSRGNTYSRKHAHFSSEDSEYWNFSWEELAKYDFPVTIEYALKTSNTSQLMYIAHSQGARIALAHLSENPKFGSKLKHLFALSPPVYLNDVRSPINLFSSISGLALSVLEMLTGPEFLSSSEFFKRIGRTVCVDEASLCFGIITTLVGGSSAHSNTSRMPTYLTYSPAGTSIKNMKHYFQGMKSNQFAKYDYGYVSNLWKYGSIWPPAYDLAKVNVPMTIFSSPDDGLVGPEDIAKSRTILGDNVKKWHPIASYNHLDFVWGIDAHSLIYSNILKSMKDMESTKN